MTRPPISRLSILIVNYNSWRVCVDMLRSLREHAPRTAGGTPLPFEVILVDNASPMRDEPAEAELQVELDAIAALPECGSELVWHDQNGGYGKGMNLAYERATGDGILICNPDLLFLPGCIERLVRHHDTTPGVGASAPEGFWDVTCEGRLPPNILPTLGDLAALFLASLSPRFVRGYARRRSRAALPIWSATQDIDLEMLSGCCFLMHRQTIESIGLFDERFPLYYEDTDLSVRIRKAGLRIVQVHGSKLVHLYNRSGQTDNSLALSRYYISRRLYYRKWYGVLGGLLYGFTRWIQQMGWAKRRSELNPRPVIRQLGAHKTPPVIEFDREYGRVLVEICLDPCFFLAAATFGSGRWWTVGDRLFDSFGPTTYYFRVLDLDAGEPREIGIYTYTRLPWDAPEPAEAQLV